MATTTKAETSKSATTKPAPAKAAKAAKAKSTATGTSQGRAFDVRKAVTDAGYIAVGLGVLSAQQVQVRRQRLGEQLQSVTDELMSAAKQRAEGFKQLADKFPTVEVSSRIDEMKARVAVARTRANEIGETTRGRVAPVVDQLEVRVTELPAPLPRAAAPVVKAAKQLIAV